MVPSPMPPAERGPPLVSALFVAVVVVGIVLAMLVGTSRCDSRPGNRPFRGRGVVAPA